jgi:hypothetical protein
MPLKFVCEECGEVIISGVAERGQEMICKQCGHRFTVYRNAVQTDEKPNEMAEVVTPRRGGHRPGGPGDGSWEPSEEDHDHPKTIGGILDEAFLFYGRNILQVLALGVVPGAAYAGLGYLMASTMMRFSVESIIANLPQILAWGLLLILLFALMHGLMVHAVLQSRVGKKVNLVKALRRVRRRVGPLLGARFASGLVLLAVAAGGVGVFYLLGAVGKAPIAAFFFSIILTCVWIYLYITWLFVEHAVIVEDCSSLEALRRSERWAKGQRWSLFGSMLVFHIVVMLFSLSPSPFSVLGGNLVTQILALPLYSIAATLLYLDVRLRRERFRTRDVERILEGR